MNVNSVNVRETMQNFYEGSKKNFENIIVSNTYDSDVNKNYFLKKKFLIFLNFLAKKRRTF